MFCSCKREVRGPVEGFFFFIRSCGPFVWWVCDRIEVEIDVIVKGINRYGIGIVGSGVPQC